MQASEISLTLPSFEEIKVNSLDFFVRYGLTEFELDLAQEIVKRFHKRLGSDGPQAGDIVIIKDHNGTILRDKGHIESIDTDPDDGRSPVTICENTSPYVPFVSIGSVDLVDSGFYLKFDTSGGPWTGCQVSSLQTTGEIVMKRFKAWGRFGAVGSGCIFFDGPVRVWALTREN